MYEFTYDTDQIGHQHWQLHTPMTAINHAPWARVAAALLLSRWHEQYLLKLGHFFLDVAPNKAKYLWAYHCSVALVCGQCSTRRACVQLEASSGMETALCLDDATAAFTAAPPCGLCRQPQSMLVPSVLLFLFKSTLMGFGMGTFESFLYGPLLVVLIPCRAQFAASRLVERSSSVCTASLPSSYARREGIARDSAAEGTTTFGFNVRRRTHSHLVTCSLTYLYR
jgi:hypothetical protein